MERILARQAVDDPVEQLANGLFTAQPPLLVNLFESGRKLLGRHSDAWAVPLLVPAKPSVPVFATAFSETEPEDRAGSFVHDIGAPVAAKQRVGERSFRECARAAAEPQGCAGSDRQQVDAGFTVLFLLEIDEREHGEPVNAYQPRLDTFGSELSQVLAGDGGVRAHVDDVMSLVTGSPEVVDDLRDHALGDMGLAEADLVRHQEPERRILILEHPLERPHGGAPLEVLQVRERGCHIDPRLGHRVPVPSTATS